MYYPDEVIEEVRMKNDIVDVISGYVKLQEKRSQFILAFVLSIMKNHLLFPFLRENRCITALAAELEEMFLPL